MGRNRNRKRTGVDLSHIWGIKKYRKKVTNVKKRQNWKISLYS